jgi:hypothetical protein
MLMSEFVPPAPGVSAVDEANGKSCPYCGQTMDIEVHDRYPTRDHILPRCRGGRADGSGNIVIVCFACNNAKDNRTLGEFLLDLAKVNDPRSFRIAMLISAIYSVMDTREANRLVSGEPKSRGVLRQHQPTRGGIPKKCYIPECDCVGYCRGVQRNGGPLVAVEAPPASHAT